MRHTLKFFEFSLIMFILSSALVFALAPVVLGFLFVDAYAQEVIPVNQTVPCFLNDTAGVDIFRNCGMGNDYLMTAVMPWNWISGGWFSPIVVGLFVLMSYIKYHKAIFPLATGVAFLPIAFFWFPRDILNFAIVYASLVIICLIYVIYMRQTKEYSG